MDAGQVGPLSSPQGHGGQVLQSAQSPEGDAGEEEKGSIRAGVERVQE